MSHWLTPNGQRTPSRVAPGYCWPTTPAASLKVIIYSGSMSLKRLLLRYSRNAGLVAEAHRSADALDIGIAWDRLVVGASEFAVDGGAAD